VGANGEFGMTTMSRRQLLVSMAKGGLAASVAAPLVRTLEPWTLLAGSRSAGTGCLWGSTNYKGGIDKWEALIGRQYHIEHLYQAWDEPLLSSRARQSVAEGRRLLLNWRATNRSDHAPIRWADIADGKQDAVIRARAEELKAFAAPGRPKIALAFHHEPENDRDDSPSLAPNGSIEEYKAAFRRVHRIMTRRGVKNVLWTLILFGSSYRNGKVDLYYPGDDVVDIVGADGFNWYGAKPGARWESFRAIFQAHHQFAVDRGKRAWACEVGTLEDPNDPGRKAQWFLDMAETVKDWPKMKALVYFVGGQYYWGVDSSDQALRAYKQVGSSAYFS
jgi:hypothetical protein